MKNGFTAKKVTFCGQQGYDLSQYIDGQEVVIMENGSFVI